MGLKIKTLEDLKTIRERTHAQMKIRDGNFSASVVVAMGACGISAGARDVVIAILDELEKRGITDVSVTQSACKGKCEQEPLVDVTKHGEPTVTYARVDAARARRIISQHLVDGSVVGDWVLSKL